MNITFIDINGTPHMYEQGEIPSFKVFARCSKQRWLVMASNEGDLFNPNEINDNLNRKDRERGGDFFKLQKCSKECYEQYTTFLRSKNLTHYLIAQRRFRNDI